ncbi:LbtU family siderophore porin [Thiothrix subterranea]|uniref:LbtU family siderophore porin n=1 Tax=Thiothrix subterranea TaxID=2735563 RepID=A0AA51MPY1_9GAMM|nr:LbtU family siderophore porin [Thiothrix subterranea]MDQ5769477.1 LbtU family siderophore porin [Thiothrix subterranea]WML86312.1 LbtU family siderophore porin [Thiothrix subterranea]
MKKTVLSILIGASLASPTFAETTLSGVVEVEAGFVSNDDGNSSDLTVPTVELGIDNQINDKLDGHLLFLYEQGENDDTIAVDEATLTFKPREGLDVSAGRMYVPFGKFDSHMVSDPLTLEMAETQEEAVQLGVSAGNVSGSVYVFKDDEDGGEKMDDYGVNLDYSTDNLSAGVSYISDVNDKAAAGLGIHASATVGTATVIAEHIKVDEITLEDDSNVEPSATNLEVGFDIGNDRTVALAYQQTDAAESLELPEKAAGIAYSMPVYEKASFAAEYMNNEAYDGSKEDVITLQVAYEF